MDLYSETILDHYHSPRHGRPLPRPTIRVMESNNFCGDSVQLDLKISRGKIKDIGFSSVGCAISQAAMSLLADEAIGKKTAALARWKTRKMYDLLSVPISPGRARCALLGLVAMQSAIKKLKSS